MYEHYRKTFLINSCLTKPWLVLASNCCKKHNSWHHEYRQNQIPTYTSSFISSWYEAIRRMWSRSLCKINFINGSLCKMKISMCRKIIFHLQLSVAIMFVIKKTKSWRLKKELKTPFTAILKSRVHFSCFNFGRNHLWNKK